MGPAQAVPVEPRQLVPSGVLGMAIFLATEVMFFAGLISAYLVLRAQVPDWPPPDQPRLPVAVTGANGAVLLLSAWTMQRACAAPGPRVRWLGATVVLGGIFLAVQGSEWARLLHYGLTTSSSLYGATFYTLIGAHGLHVLAASIVLAVTLRSAARGRSRGDAAPRLAPVRMYWLFVVGIWPVLYALVYLS